MLDACKVSSSRLIGGDLIRNVYLVGSLTFKFRKRLGSTLVKRPRI